MYSAFCLCICISKRWSYCAYPRYRDIKRSFFSGQPSTPSTFSLHSARKNHRSQTSRRPHRRDACCNRRAFLKCNVLNKSWQIENHGEREREQDIVLVENIGREQARQAMEGLEAWKPGSREAGKPGSPARGQGGEALEAGKLMALKNTKVSLH